MKLNEFKYIPILDKNIPVGKRTTINIQGQRENTKRWSEHLSEITFELLFENAGNCYAIQSTHCMVWATYRLLLQELLGHGKC